MNQLVFEKKGNPMVQRRSDGLRTQKRILSACVKLFLEQGYHKTTMKNIYDAAGVSASSFQNLFGSKDGVLMDLTEFMFSNQFDVAGDSTGEDLPPVYLYAMETSIQLALTELNENIRDVYLECYTFMDTLDYIQHATAGMLYQIFGPYQPELTEDDFYRVDFGTGGLMRGYMANPCTEDFPLEAKLQAFLTLTLRGLKVPEDEVQQTLAYIAGLDIRNIALKVMNKLFKELSMHYEFSLEGIALEK